MSRCFLKVLNSSIMASWLALAVVLLRVVLKKAPKWVHCLLWGLVALRLLLPFTIESRLSLLPSADPVRTEAAAVEPAAEAEAAPVLYERVVLKSGFAAVDDAVNPIMAKTAEDMARTGTARIASARTMAAKVWIIGVGVMLIYAAVSFRTMKQKVRASIETERNVYVCDDVYSPFILGAIHPRIYLPSGLDGKSRAHVLAHERAHIQRLDHLSKPLGFLLLSIHWFNPLIWVAFILLSRDIELACDERVISQLDVEGKIAYSHTLLAFSHPHRTIAICPVAFGEVGVKERVRSVLQYKKPALWIVLTALIAVAAVALCFLTAPRPVRTAQAPADTIRTASPKPQLPQRPDGADADDAIEPERKKWLASPDLLTCVDQQCIEAE